MTASPTAAADNQNSPPEKDIATRKLPRKRRDRGAPRLRFWFILLWQTWRGRDLMALSGEMRDNFVVEGLDYVPPQGIFTLAANHSLRRWTPRMLSAIHHATMQARPDLAREWLVVVGYKEAQLEGKPFPVRWAVLRLRRFYGWLYRRWEHNLVRLPMANQRASILALRDWKVRAKQQPTMVFPEGIGAYQFREVRPGAGRWLGTFDVPVLPVSAWWDSPKQTWQIVFGLPIEWSDEPQLHDLQLGLEIALGLPEAEAPDWQEPLRRWQQAWS